MTDDGRMTSRYVYTHILFRTFVLYFVLYRTYYKLQHTSKLQFRMFNFGSKYAPLKVCMFEPFNINSRHPSCFHEKIGGVVRGFSDVHKREWMFSDVLHNFRS